VKRAVIQTTVTRPFWPVCIDSEGLEKSHKIARLPLDFRAQQSVCGGKDAAMDAQMLEAS
jgi:hypothetical protein